MGLQVGPAGRRPYQGSCGELEPGPAVISLKPGLTALRLTQGHRPGQVGGARGIFRDGQGWESQRVTAFSTAVKSLELAVVLTKLEDR